MKKTKILVVTLLAGFVLHQTAWCQTNTTNTAPTVAGGVVANPAASNGVYAAMVSNVVKFSTTDTKAVSNAPATIVGGNNPTAGSTMSNTAAAGASPATAEGSNQPVSFTTGNQSGSATISNVTAGTSGSNTPAAMTGSNEVASGTSVSNAAAEASSTNAAAAGTNAPTAAAELPIQFQDVPITTAIESLARLAGINYLLDPKIGYGVPDQNGQIKPEPTLSNRWENVTAQQALLALLDNYGLQLLGNPKTGIYKVTTKDLSAPPPLITRVIQLKYSSTSNMIGAVVGTLTDKRSKVVPDARTSQLVVVATETEQADVDMLITELDKATRQVLIELSSNPSTVKGIDWAGTLQAQNVAFGNGALSGTATTTSPGTPVTTPGLPLPGGGSTPSTTTTPGSSTVSSLISSIGNGGFAASTASGLLPDTGFLTADGVRAVISFLNQSSDAQVVSTPRVVTLDGETATISVTRDFPVINVTAGTQNTAGGSSITYSNIGTLLVVTPRITANDYISLKVIPDVSSFFGKDTESIGNGLTISADIFDQRHIETQVLIPNAHTLVMGGLVQDNPSVSTTKVPILGDIPFLGLAFRHESKSMVKDNLLIFITPTIVRDTDFKPMTTDFLNSVPRTMKDPMDMHSWWDSSRPRGDWSNPLTADKAHNPEPDKTKPLP
jgi:type II secretory pathway component GspD/PulD (secretin)